MRARPTAIAIAAATVLAACAAASARTGQAGGQLQRVTVIGDSVADGIAGDARAQGILGGEVRVDLETAACRRVTGLSCPVDGVAPPNVLQLVQTLGASLAPNVVVAVGYNDYEDQYAQGIEATLAALRSAGVKRVWWLTLRAVRHPYLSMNADILAAARHHPELQVIDWNLYSRSHPDWFQPDGLHLLAAGSEAMATLIHQTLLAAGVAYQPVSIATSSLPPARRGRPYSAALQASAGSVPYRWSLLARAPLGVHLESSGAVIGAPRAPAGVYRLPVQVVDASGLAVQRAVTLRIRG